MKKNRMVWQIVIALITLPLIGLLLALLLREPITRASEWFVGNFGLIGVFVGILCTDVTPGMISEPILFAGYQGGLGFWWVVLVGGTASFLAGPLGWLIGKGLGRLRFVQKIFDRFEVAPFLHKYGFWAIGVAALTPFPYALTTWAAGAVNVPLSRVLLGALLRYPKVLIYLSLLILGWIAV